MKRLSAVVLLLVAAPLWADPPSVALPEKMSVRPGRLVKIDLKTDAKSWQWLGPEGDADLIAGDGVRWAVFSAPAAGKYRVVVFAASATGETAQAVCWVTVEGPSPPPPPPPPPPQPVAGLRVLVVYESADLGKMPRGQLDVIYGQAVRSYLQAKTTPTADGGRRGWYIADQNTDFSVESPAWQEAMKRPRASLPWLVLTDGGGKVVWEGPLPADVPAMLAKLKQYGG